MRICDLHSGRNRLTRAAQLLRDQWSQTCDHWDDANQRDFYQNHLQPLAPQITLMLSAVHRLSEVLQQAERECSDDDE